MKHTLMALLATLTVSTQAMANIHATGINDEAIIYKSCHIDIATGRDGIAVVTAADSENTYNFWMLAEAVFSVKTGPLWLLEQVGVLEKRDGKTIYSNEKADAGAARLMVVRDQKGKLDKFELEHVNAKGEVVNAISCIRLRTR